MNKKQYVEENPFEHELVTMNKDDGTQMVFYKIVQNRFVQDKGTSSITEKSFWIMKEKLPMFKQYVKDLE